MSLVATIRHSKYEPMETATVGSSDSLHNNKYHGQLLQGPLGAAGTALRRMSLHMEDEDREAKESYRRTLEATSTTFSPQVIAFALFGTISKLSCVKEATTLFRDKISQVTQQFPDIPDIFIFGPSTVQFNTVGVFCKQSLNQGAVLGPFTGRKLSPEEVMKLKFKSYWEIHHNGKIQYCLDGSDPHYRNWMYFIQYARNQDEQNLMAIQHEDKLYFRAMREILLGEELLVWYDKHQYDLYMGIPQGFNKDAISDCDELINDPVSEEEEEEEEEEIEVIETDEEGDIEEEDTSLNHSSSSHMSTSSPTHHHHIEHTSPPFSTGIPPPHGMTATTPFTVYPLPNLHWLKPSRPPPPPPPPMIGSPLLTMPRSWPTFPPLSPTHLGKASNLDMFERWADGTRWRCQICQRIFTSQGSLRAHARIHTGEKPYQCQFCKRVFTQASTLRSHERLHTGEKPYKCDHCGKAFTQSAGLRSHLKTHITH